jgi:hypothetical protein
MPAAGRRVNAAFVWIRNGRRGVSCVMRASLPRLAMLGAVALLCDCAGAEIANTEQLLGAAGFQMLPADTPERRNELALLPSHQLLVQEQQGNPARFTYIYSDPDQCHCLWIGDPRNYQAFQQLALQQRIAEDQLQAAELYSNPWGPWGPGFGTTVIVEPHEHEHGHHHH